MAISRTSHYSASWIRSHYRRLEGLPAPHQAWTADTLDDETREMLRGLRAHDIIHSCGWDDDGRRTYETDPAAYRAVQEYLEADDDSDSPLPCDCPFRIRRHAETIECLECETVYDVADLPGGRDE